MDSSIFWPENKVGRRHDTLPARIVCSTCPVRPDCHDYAMSCGDDLMGIWAGTTPADRRRLRQRESIQTLQSSAPAV